MNAFATLVWKEWRGERRSIVALAVAAAVVPWLGLVVSRSLVGQFGYAKYTYDGSTATIVAQAALLAVALSLGAELVPGESRRGTIALLRRMPCGLLESFAAKIVLLLAMALAIAVIAWLSACVAIGGTGGPWFPRYEATPFLLVGAPSLLLVALIGGWTLAASTWLSRATLALPAAALALALTIAPLRALAVQFPGLLLRPRELQTLAWGATLAAPCIAALSFVFGRRHGGGERRSLAIGLVTTLALSLPAYGWMSARIAEWGRIDPTAETFRFVDLPFDDALSDDGRFAYMTVHHAFGSWDGHDRRVRRAGNWANEGDGPPLPIQIDLASGAWRAVGPAGATVMAPKLDAVALPERYVWIAPFSEMRVESAMANVLLDARTGEERVRVPLVSDRRGHLLAGRPELLEFNRGRQAIYLPDGRVVWAHRGEFVTTNADGSIRVLPDSTVRGGGIQAARGLGYWMWRDRASTQGGHEIYDLARERRYPLPSFDQHPSVRFGRWIVTPPGRKTSSWEKEPFWALYDPDTGITTPAPAAVASDKLFWFDDDGATFGGRCNEQGTVDELFRIDPELGTRERVALPPWLSGSIYRICVAARTRRGIPILRVSWASAGLQPTSHFALWDRARRELAFAGDADTPQMEPIGCPDEETLLAVEEQRKLMRLRFGSATRELVFPRPGTKSEALR